MADKKVFAMKNGKPGYIINGVFHPIAKSEYDKQQFKDDLARYEKARGAEQLKKDSEKVQSSKKPDPKEEAPKEKPQLADIRGGDGKTKYGDGTPIKTKTIEVTPYTDTDTKTKTEPPKQAPKPRQTPQQKAGLPSSVPAAVVPDVVKYQKARQKAVASGDQSQMDKVSNAGMAIWAKLYGPGGKKELKYPSAKQQDIFNKYSSNTTNQGSSGTLTSSQKTEILRRGAEARQSIEKEAQRRGIPKMDDKKLLGKVGAEVKFESTNTAKDPYDLILEYLLENGHADTIDEANYIMLKLDSQSIKTIVENL